MRLVKRDELKALLDKEFDLVGIISSSLYQEELYKLTKKSVDMPYETLAVVAYSYPKRILKHSSTYLVPSMYTFGRDYHLILKEKMDKALENTNLSYQCFVDNHEYHERLAAELAGIGYTGKNQLLITKDYGSFVFLGLIFVDLPYAHPNIHFHMDSCGDCHKCIDACPTSALSEEGYLVDRCLSAVNQSKKVLSIDEINKNYLLFGCDICQMVCPKNKEILSLNHFEFEYSGKEQVSIDDLFDLSENEFKNKYRDMAYLWRGKTILLRNALTLLLRNNNQSYNDKIEESIHKYSVPWYQDTAKYVLEKLKK